MVRVVGQSDELALVTCDHWDAELWGHIVYR